MKRRGRRIGQNAEKRGEGPGNGLSEGLDESLGEGRNGLMKKRGNQIPSPEYTVSGDYSRPLLGAHPTGLSSQPTVIPSWQEA